MRRARPPASTPRSVADPWPARLRPMILVMKSDLPRESEELERVVALAESFTGIRAQVHVIQGATRSLTEVHLHGSTGVIPTKPFEEFEGVEKVVRITEKFRAIGRHDGQLAAVGF